MTCILRMSLKPCLLLILTCCLGCSGGSDVELGKVTGLVTMNGEPLADAIVVFKPAEGNPSTGRTDSNGNYDLTYLGNSPGAIVGKHSVRITTGQPLGEMAGVNADTDFASMDSADTIDISTPPAESEADVTMRRARPKPKKTGKEVIPARYNTKTELQADVTDGDNVIDFDLSID